MKIDESNIVETNDYRVIIYPASRPFTTKEAKVITEKLYDFAPILNNSIHMRTINAYIFAIVNSTKSLNF